MCLESFFNDCSGCMQGALSRGFNTFGLIAAGPPGFLSFAGGVLMFEASSLSQQWVLPVLQNDI